MASVPIYGTNPAGQTNRIYALYCPKGEEERYIKTAEEAGWHDLFALAAQPELWEDPNPAESASSDAPTSPPKKRRSSRTSANA